MIEQALCPQCDNIIPGANINSETGLAKCEQCGTIEKQDDLKVANGGQGDDTMPELPPLGRIMVISHNADRLELYLPKNNFGCSGALPLIFSLFWTSTVLGMGFLNGMFVSFPKGILFIGFAMVGILIFISEINRVKREEYLTMEQGQITLTKKLPIGWKSTKSYELKEIQGVEFERLSGRDNYSLFWINLVLGGKKVSFFSSSEMNTLRGLANYLDQLVKKHWDS